MAVPGIRNHRKFKRLRFILKDLPDVYIEAHLNAMWNPCYQSGNPMLGEQIDVELAAEWSDSKRETGEWFKAVLKAGFIDPVEQDGTRRDAGDADARPCVHYAVHDLFDWAPDYVLERAKKANHRRTERRCEQCGDPYSSSEPHAKYCSTACRKRAFRDKAKKSDDDCGTQRDAAGRSGTEATVAGTQRDGLPSPPLPVLIDINIGAEVFESTTIGGVPVTAEMRAMVFSAFSDWSVSSEKKELHAMHNDDREIRMMLDSLTPQERMKVMPAISFCKSEGKRFKKPAYAVTVLRGVIESGEYAAPKRANGKNFTPPQPPRRSATETTFDHNGE